MKKFNIILFTLCIVLLLSGCSKPNFSSIEDLISPVTPSGDNADVQLALADYCKKGYSLKVPSGGAHTTAFVYEDLDGDGESEALAFYEPGEELGTVNMSVIKKDNKKWIVVSTVVGDGSDVSAVDFCDLTGDGDMEVIVGWSVISKSSVSEIDVYKLTDKSALSYEVINNPITADEFICSDVNDDGEKELLTFSTGSANESPYSELYTFSSGSESRIGYTKLDSSIISFESIIVGKTDAGTSVYADALKADGSSMVTEFIYYSNYYDSIVSPLYSYSTGKTAETTRTDLLLCRDVDGDGVIEVPTDADRDTGAAQLKFDDWKEYKSTIFSHKHYSLSCRHDSYILLLSDSEYDALSFTYDEQNRELRAYDGDDECFEIKAVVKSAYDSNQLDLGGFTKVFENSGYVYLAYINGSSDYTSDNLVDMIRAY